MTRTLNTYTYLRKAALSALQEARNSEVDQFYNCMVCNVFCAFCFEAYLNHVGLHILRLWDQEEERGLGVKDKTRQISDVIGVQIDFGRGTFQTVGDVIRFRNFSAHGKTVVLRNNEASYFETVGDFQFPMTKWEAQCSLGFAEEALDATEAAIRELHAALPVQDPPLISDPFAVLASGGGQSTKDTAA